MYWQDRMAKSQQKLTSKSIAETEKQLIKYYNKAMKSVIDDFEQTYQKLLDTITDERQPTPADLYKLDKYWQLQGQLRQKLQSLGDKQAVLFSKNFEQQFKDIYNATALSDTDNFFSSMDEQGAKQMINQVWCADGKSWSNRVWDNTDKLQQALNDNLIDCVVSGKKTSQLKEILQEQFKVSYNRADSLVRTEMAHIQTQAAQQRYKDAGITEFEVWADEDERRCDVCGKLHEKRFSINERVPVPVHPRCRCCIIPRLDSLTLSKPYVNMVKSELVGIPASKTSGSNEDIREWYYVNIHDIPNKIDYSLPLEKQAEQACNIRNQIKVEAREAMKDKKIAAKLNTDEKPKTLEQLIDSKMYRYQMTREEALKDVIRSASITREAVDKEMFGG